MKNDTIVFAVANQRLGDWLSLLRNGFIITTTQRVLPLVLEEALGMDRAFVDKEVRTIFINGRPVDRMDSAEVRQGDSIALAGAMPGLVGACMRRDSPLSGFRNSITYEKTGQARQEGGTATLEAKLFSSVAETLGPRLLEKGVLVESKALIPFLENRTLAPLSGAVSAELNGRPLEPARAAERLGNAGSRVVVRIVAADAV